MQRTLIVNADDFGLSPAINRGIVEAHQQGIVTSCSLVASGRAFADAVDLAKANPSLDIGIHLTLVEERAVLDPHKIPSLVDESGDFPAHAVDFSKKYLLRRIRSKEIRKELEAQIRKLLDQGIRISHLDSHQHLHILPGIFKLVAQLAKSYQIPIIRLPQEPLKVSGLFQRHRVNRNLEQLILWGFCQNAKRARCQSTQHFRGFSVGGNLTFERLVDILKNLPPGTTELMCHPGLDEIEAPYRSWNYQHAAELEALTAAESKALLNQLGVRLCSFRDLTATDFH